jgi:hypothetical protein
MSRRQYVVTLAERDWIWCEDIRRAVDGALVTRNELKSSHVMILKPKRRRDQVGTTLIRGPLPAGVRVLMNVVADVTGGSVTGEMLPT